MSKIKEAWSKASWQVKTIVVVIGLAVVTKLVLWLESINLITNVVK